MSTEIKVLLLVFAILVLIYLLWNGCGGSENGEHFSIPESKPAPVLRPSASNPHPLQPPSGEDKYFPPNDFAPPESEWLKKKFDGRNKASSNEYKQSSYSGGKRGSLGPSEWADYFDHNNNIIANAQSGQNDKFVPIDETNGELAIFKSQSKKTCGSSQDCEPEDLFNAEDYLPQEVNDDWFEVQPEPISVKNRHLINVTKPIGVNTIGTSLRNASHDIRGTPSCPKFVISPFMNTSIEPDTNLKPHLG